MFELTQGEGRYQVRFRVLTADGNGLVVFITGGERPHLGGTALASLPPQGCGDLSSCDTSTQTMLPGKRYGISAVRRRNWRNGSSANIL